MKVHPYLIGSALLLTLGACYPLAADYTESQAPKNLVVDRVSSRVDLRFLPGSAQLVPRDAWRLHALAASGGIAPSDRVAVATAGGPALATARFNTIAAELLRYRIVASNQPLAGVPANRAIVDTGRYLVTLPRCPDWSKEATARFDNTSSSNFGCATAVNLGLSVANPADLAEARPVAHTTDGVPAASAIQRYEADRVQLPGAAALTTLPAAPAAPAGGAGAGAQP